MRLAALIGRWDERVNTGQNQKVNRDDLNALRRVRLFSACLRGFDFVKLSNVILDAQCQATLTTVKRSEVIKAPLGLQERMMTLRQMPSPTLEEVRPHYQPSMETGRKLISFDDATHGAREDTGNKKEFLPNEPIFKFSQVVVFESFNLDFKGF